LAAALVVSLAAGLLSPLQPRFALVTSLIAPLVLRLLVCLPSWPERDPPEPPVRIASWARVVVGVVAGLGFVLVLGPGLGSFAATPSLADSPTTLRLSKAGRWRGGMPGGQGRMFGTRRRSGEA
jgi:hypothetical protein